MKCPPSSHSNVALPSTAPSNSGWVASVAQVPISSSNGARMGSRSVTCVGLSHRAELIARLAGGRRSAPAEDDGADEEALLVDEEVRRQACGQGGAADGDRPAVLFFERLHLLGGIAAEPSRSMRAPPARTNVSRRSRRPIPRRRQRAPVTSTERWAWIFRSSSNRACAINGLATRALPRSLGRSAWGGSDGMGRS
jgi:hypothetical protein